VEEAAGRALGDRSVMDLVCIILSHWSVPARERSPLKLDKRKQVKLLKRLGQPPTEVLLVSTCGRVEVYLYSPEAAHAIELARLALRRRGVADALGVPLQVPQGSQALEHLVCVASGLDSMVPGEQQILAVLVVGAGDTGELLCQRLKQEEVARLLIINRTPERARELASKVGGIPRSFEELTAVMSEVSVVVCATSSPKSFLTSKNVWTVQAARRGEPLHLVDLSVPMNIAPDVVELEGVHA
jgi:glutamyl-tRNA reductase